MVSVDGSAAIAASLIVNPMDIGLPALSVFIHDFILPEPRKRASPLYTVCLDESFVQPAKVSATAAISKNE